MMQINVTMVIDQRLTVGQWTANSPIEVIETLREQLVAAKAVWPSLQRYSLEALPHVVNTDQCESGEHIHMEEKK
jgi:hypothetical protein